MKLRTLLLCLAPGLAFAAAPDGKIIALHGNENGALPCAACHGANGAGKTAIGAPALAGMPAAAITGFLRQYAAGQGRQRPHAIHCPRPQPGGNSGRGAIFRWVAPAAKPQVGWFSAA